MKMIFLIPVVVGLSMIVSCDIFGNEFKEPFNHPGSKNYAVKTVIPKSYNSYYFKQDTIDGHIYVTKAFESEDEHYKGTRMVANLTLRPKSDDELDRWKEKLTEKKGKRRKATFAFACLPKARKK